MTRTDPSTDDVHAVLRRWAAAEVAGDAAELDLLLAAGFTGVGPLGFVLRKQDWLGRHAGGLDYQRFDLSEAAVTRYGETTVVVARQDADGTWQGRPVPGSLRVSVVLTGAGDGSPRIALLAMGFIAGTPGAPPLPGRPAPRGTGPS